MPRVNRDKCIDNNDFPLRYTPSSLRSVEEPERIETVYACGYDEGNGSYGMFHGPSPDLKEMLEVVPDDDSRKAVIIKFDKEGTDDVMYTWEGSEWVHISVIGLRSKRDARS